MMKKTLLLTAIAVLAISASACSKKEEPAVTTEAVTEAATEAVATEEETEEETEEVEEDYVSGILSAIDGNILTVQTDDDQEVKYDISSAELIQQFPLSEGDWVDITFPAESTEDPIPAMVVEVMESVIGMNTDPSVEGTVADASTNTITLEVDGEQYTMSKANAYVVAKEGILVDKKATVTYLGDLDDEPIAVKIVMEDSYNTPEAEKFAFVGTVVQIGDDGSNIVLESESEDFFTFGSQDIDFREYKEGQQVQISYTGTIGAKEIPAVAIEKK